jgi:hypothetical protein
LRTPTGTSTLGGGCLKTLAACSSGGMVEQYSIGLFGLGCLPRGILLAPSTPSFREDGDPDALSPCSTWNTTPKYTFQFCGLRKILFKRGHYVVLQNTNMYSALSIAHSINQFYYTHTSYKLI